MEASKEMVRAILDAATEHDDIGDIASGNEGIADIANEEVAADDEDDIAADGKKNKKHKKCKTHTIIIK